MNRFTRGQKIKILSNQHYGGYTPGDIVTYCEPYSGADNAHYVQDESGEKCYHHEEELEIYDPFPIPSPKTYD